MIIFDRILIALVVAISAIVIGSLSFFWIRSHWYTDIRPIFAGKVVTSPDDPKFDPMQFRFEYYKEKYGNEWDLPKALIKMFPPGTDKSYIDKILVEGAGAGVSKSIENEAKYAYQWPSWATMGGKLLFIYFDEQWKSRSFFSGGVRYYEDRTFSDNFMIKHHEERAQHPSAGYRYVEGHMRPIRKQYLGIEDGILK